MLLGLFLRNTSLVGNLRLLDMLKKLGKSGCDTYYIYDDDEVRDGTDMVLSIGGDGTFLSASKKVAGTGIPVLGVNLGRLGFLSENLPEDAADAILSGRYELEDRTLLSVSVSDQKLNKDVGFCPYALNEVTIHRSGAAILGINVRMNGDKLPTCWADGLIVATSSGSTAYALSAGGPICSPDAKVLIIEPIAPHNLNVRPLVVPESTDIIITISSRDDEAVLTMDNRNYTIRPDAEVKVSVAQFSLKRVRLPKSSFVKALKSKLFWGEDIRNNDD